MTEREEKAVEALFAAGKCEDRRDLLHAVDRALVGQATYDSEDMVNDLIDRGIIRFQQSVEDGPNLTPRSYWYEKGEKYGQG